MAQQNPDAGDGPRDDAEYGCEPETGEWNPVEQDDTDRERLTVEADLSGVPDAGADIEAHRRLILEIHAAVEEAVSHEGCDTHYRSVEIQPLGEDRSAADGGE
jgi:hypothetical protein